MPDEEIPVPGSDDRILLAARTTTSDGSGNLFRLRPDGTEVWRLAAPEGVGDSWTAVRIEGDAVVANSWSCYLVSIDLTSGEERSRIFAK